jgi:three-Cys-motif partner protein
VSAMSKQLGTVWQLEPHTAKKHEILRRYFDAWLPILATTNGRVVYIDGFAGPGVYSGGEDGSPVIVLKAAANHKYKPATELCCLFVEADTKRYDRLVSVLAALKPTLSKNIKFETVNKTFDNEITRILDDIDHKNQSLAPTLAFIDPFGFKHTPFKTIARLMEHPKCEILFTFMYEEINRFLSLPDYAETFDELFGCSDWRDALELSTPEEKVAGLRDLYLRQLQTVGKYARSFQMINKGNRVDYFLFFVTNNPLGLQRMKESMWKVDSTGEFQFSDLTDASHQYLLAFASNFEPLREMIVAAFGGVEIEITTLEQWVVTDTPYLPKHLRKPILEPMEDDGSLSVVAAKPGRRRHTYPPGTILKFATPTFQLT